MSIKRLTPVFTLLFLLVASSSYGFLMDILGVGSPAQRHNVDFVEGDRNAHDEVLLISIKGIIMDPDEQGAVSFEMRQNMMETFRKDLEVALERTQVKAVLVDINSPGGEVTASDIIHHGLSKVGAQGKKIVALIGSIGASGAYYVACAADAIYAHPTSIVGGIGALIQTANLEKLAEMIGYKSIIFKSEKTPKKDVLSPFKTMSPEEEAMLMELVDSIYNRFIEVVAKGRKMTVEQTEKLADGGIYSASKALEMGLIDAIGYREDAFAKAMSLAGIEKGKLVKRRTKKGIHEIIQDIAAMHSGAPAFVQLFQNMIQSQGVPVMMYRFDVQAR